MNNNEIVEQVVKHKRPKKSEQMSVQLEPGESQQFMLNALEIYDLPKINTDDVEQVTERISTYFKISAKNDVKPSVAGMALALGISRKTLWEWVSTGRKGKAITDTIKKAYDLLNLMMEDYMANGKINPVSGIFLMKNNFGYADKQEVIVTPNNPLGDMQNPDEVEQRYIESVVTDDVAD